MTVPISDGKVERAVKAAYRSAQENADPQDAWRYIDWDDQHEITRIAFRNTARAVLEADAPAIPTSDDVSAKARELAGQIRNGAPPFESHVRIIAAALAHAEHRGRVAEANAIRAVIHNLASEVDEGAGEQPFRDGLIAALLAIDARLSALAKGDPPNLVR